MMLLRTAAVALLAGGAAALCPYLPGNAADAEVRLPPGHPRPPAHLYTGGVGAREADAGRSYAEAVEALDWGSVKDDLKALFKDSKDFWPADYGNYGPLMVRLAWHSTGSYRTSDGRGGADGARQRFDPERSWEDNTNLDKARKLLEPIKEKYGKGLSWGDLIVLAGNTAVESMGGPILGFCAGRVDDPNGYWSQALGPSPEQEAYFPCETNGECESPLGSTTVGLIYLNPEGPMGNPSPEKSAHDVRDAFGRMNMDDRETVALIGGGHAYGKAHGACSDGAGPSPEEDWKNPWPGMCGSGKGADAFTSGFEGPWTTSPTSWDNQYFQNLVGHEWKVKKGPGGHYQWHAEAADLYAPAAHGHGRETQEVMMLTSDVSLTKDPEGSYPKIVKEFAEDIQAFDEAWMHAWYKLTTRDMGPVARCVGPDVPPAQAWQFPLPPAPENPPDFHAVRVDVDAAVDRERAPALVHLAWRCAASFRTTDYLGGCDGARLRHGPEKDWPANAGVREALKLLEPVKEKHGDGLTWADLIVLAGTAAVESFAGVDIPFCAGRSDAEDDGGSAYLGGSLLAEIPTSDDTVGALAGAVKITGLSVREYVALSGGHSLGGMHRETSGYTGSWTSNPLTLDNEYFKNLLHEDWKVHKSHGKLQYKADGKELYALESDLMLLWDAEFLAVVQEFASDNDAFLQAFVHAWVKFMNIDRFDGPTGNLCYDNHNMPVQQHTTAFA